jgi:hypothetical protein
MQAPLVVPIPLPDRGELKVDPVGNRRGDQRATAPSAMLLEALLEVLREADVVPCVPVGALVTERSAHGRVCDRCSCGERGTRPSAAPRVRGHRGGWDSGAETPARSRNRPRRTPCSPPARNTRVDRAAGSRARSGCGRDLPARASTPAKPWSDRCPGSGPGTGGCRSARARPRRSCQSRRSCLWATV